MSVFRAELYSYVANLFTGFTKNIYRISIPETLGADAVTNGFMVLNMGEVRDYSEFGENAYAQARIYVQYYVPNASTSTANGIMNTAKYDDAQKRIDAILEAEYNKINQPYTISRDDILSTDDFYTNKTNSFSVYIKSFIITTN